MQMLKPSDACRNFCCARGRRTSPISALSRCAEWAVWKAAIFPGSPSVRHVMEWGGGVVDREDAEIQCTCVRVCVRTCSRGFQEERGENKQPVGTERLGIEFFFSGFYTPHTSECIYAHTLAITLAHRCVCAYELHRWLRKLLLHCTSSSLPPPHEARHLHLPSPCWQLSPEVAAFRRLKAAFARALMRWSKLPMDMLDDSVESLKENTLISLVVVFLMNLSPCHLVQSDLMRHLKAVLVNSAPQQGHVLWLSCFILKSTSSSIRSLSFPLVSPH